MTNFYLNTNSKINNLYKITKILSISIVILISGCTTGHQNFYRAFSDTRNLKDVELLRNDETPRIITTKDMKSDVKLAISNGYIPIGESAFNGELESNVGIINQAKLNGAKLVLLGSKHTETREINTPIFLPNNQTTVNSGMVYGPKGFVNYSGSSTTYGTTVVPMTTYQQRYDQHAVYFVKSTQKPKFGIRAIDLPSDIRIKLERNTGVLIDVIVNQSPAFIANLLVGDVITEINGIYIINAAQAHDVMKSQNPADGKCIIKIIRNGAEKSIILKLNNKTLG